jgi:DNA-nicking Smr family endonuclease
MAKKPEIPSRDEAELFQRAMRDATPLDGATRRRRKSPPEVPDQAAPKGRAKPARPSPPPPPARAKNLPELRSGEAAGLDRRTMDRLRRGQIRPQARLDLHGHTQDEAQAALVEFLRRAQAAGKRCVIVITGRGRIGQGGGVLRGQTPRWLNLPSMRPLVLGFAVAQPRDGGSGALYVLLKRRK